MVKITYEFDTDKEGFDYCELERVQQADSMARVIDKMNDQLRAWYKYSEKTEFNIEEIRDRWYQILNENNIDIDKLWM